jgi:ribonucleotide reductase alpha subunit
MPQIIIFVYLKTMKNKLMAHNGSVQKIEEIPASVRALYKTVWEMKGKTLVEMAADRGCYIDQSQSFNVHMADVNFAKLTSMHFYGWKRGLKTGMYYLRTQAAVDAKQVTVDPTILAKVKEAESAKFPEPKPTDGEAKESAAKTLKASSYGLVRKSQTPSTATSAKEPTIQMDFERSREDIQAEERATLERWRAERQKQQVELACSLDNPDACLSCGS